MRKLVILALMPLALLGACGGGGGRWLERRAPAPAADADARHSPGRRMSSPSSWTQVRPLWPPRRKPR